MVNILSSFPEALNPTSLISTCLSMSSYGIRPHHSCLSLALADFGGSVVGSPLRHQVLKNVAISIRDSLSFLDVVS